MPDYRAKVVNEKLCFQFVTTITCTYREVKLPWDPGSLLNIAKISKRGVNIFPPPPVGSSTLRRHYILPKFKAS